MTTSEIVTYYAKKFTPDNISGGKMVALKAIDAFSERPISEQPYWYEMKPEKDIIAILIVRNPFRFSNYIVAYWDAKTEAFYSEETNEKITQWIKWKQI